MKRVYLLLFILVVTLTGFAQSAANSPKFSLTEGWNLQSSAKVDKDGSQISTAAFVPQGWYSASVPTTVVAALVKAKVYPDPTFGMNLRYEPSL